MTKHNSARRDALEIRIDVLKFCNGQSLSITQIVNDVSLQYATAMKVVVGLCLAGALQEIVAPTDLHPWKANTKSLYMTTSSGEEIVRDYGSIVRRLGLPTTD